MRSTVLIALALVAGGALHAGTAAAATITVVPPNPTTGDAVKVVVMNEFPTACWPVSSTNCSPPAADSLYAIVDINYCGGYPYCDCATVPTGYTRTCNFGLLPAGSYVAAFFENHVNPDDPQSSFVITQPFTVTAPTPALRRTWAALKSHYR
jgi:hypothetical protein